MKNGAGEWLLGERFLTRTLEQYRAAFGGFSELFDSLGLACPSDDPAAIAGHFSSLELARLNGRAIALLAAEESRETGRQALRPGDWHVIGYVLSSGRTLRESIERCADCFQAIDGRCGRLTLRRSGEEARVELDARRSHSTAKSLLIDLHGIARVHALLSLLVAQSLPVAGVYLDYPEDRFASLGLPPLPHPLHLAQGWTGFSFPVVYLDHPVVRTLDEISRRPDDSFLFNTLGMDEEDEAISLRVRRIALRSLRDRHVLPPFEDVVDALGMSAATLRRRLARAGTNYREIRDSCRREVALDLLRHSAAPIEAISARLDFCDSDAFRRAFRDWFGVPPTTYRQRLRESAGVSRA
ncbi:MAG: helix-turn-helix domain-containing protein [Novosphingobium sp.]|nr:helix-turn-helix domain-containing protein [Novosphingobium sp.]